MEDKALIKLSETHEKLVKGLKDALKLSQLGFLQAGKFLYKIWSQKTFMSEDSSRDVTFTEFCTRADLPIPGGSDEGRLRTAQKFIRIYQFYILQKKLPINKLIPVGYTKLNLLVPIIQAKEKDLDDWLKKATILTLKDLLIEIKQKDKTFEELLDCQHKEIEKFTFYKCKNCHVTWKIDPNKK